MDNFAGDILQLLQHGGWQAVVLGCAFLAYKIGTIGIITMGIYKSIVKLADKFGRDAAKKSEDGSIAGTDGATG